MEWILQHVYVRPEDIIGPIILAAIVAICVLAAVVVCIRALIIKIRKKLKANETETR